MRFVRSIKFRLTVWYLVALAVMLVLFGTMAYFMLSNSLYQSLDTSLRTRAAQVQSSLLSNGPILSDGGTGETSQTTLLHGTNWMLLQESGSLIGTEGVDDLAAKALTGRISFANVKTADGEVIRLCATPVITEESGVTLAIIVGRSLSETEDVLRTFRNILAIAGATTAVLAGIGGLVLASQVLRPIDRMTQTARVIGESDLSRRIEVRSDDELGRLALTLNQMIERLEMAFKRQRQFTADASHELRTPVAVIRAESTLALRRERTEDDYRKSLDLISQETRRMSAVIDKLLFLARSDAGKEQLDFEEVDLKEVLSNLSPDVEVLCEERGLHFNPGPLENLVVRGDRTRLQQLFLNLLANAIRYTPSGGRISVSAIRQGEAAVIAVRDTGIGISEEHLPHIFERFYRVDEARSRVDGGAGLGLSICQHIVKVHDGKIEVESRVGEGSTFTVFLPLVEKG
jgi:heavy metal sensor kinase